MNILSHGMRRTFVLRSCVSAIAIMLFHSAAHAADDDKAVEALAKPLLEFGLSTGKLVWVSVRQPSLPEGMKPTMYSSLAMKVQKQIDEGRAAAGVVSSNFDLASAAASYAAVADPEPLSKITAGLVAYGAKKTGEYVAEKVIEDSQAKAQEVLARGLQESGIKPEQLKGMSEAEIRKTVEEFKFGKQQIGQILKDPKSLEMLQDQLVDMANDNALEALRRSDKNTLDIDVVTAKVEAARDEIDKLRDVVDKRTSALETKTEALGKAVLENKEGLENLRKEVGTNKAALEAVTEISFSGWTTQQKLQAARADLIPGLEPKQKAALVASLEAQQHQEALIKDVSGVAGDLREIGGIARNLGLPPEVVKTVDTASTLATGAAQFLSGNYLGAISAVTSLMGMGGPDPAAERHAQMMKYLAEQFEQINLKLDKIIKLQVETIKALDKLREEQQQFRIDVLTQLSRMESVLIANNTILQALLKQEWRSCDALVNNKTMNGLLAIEDREQLLDLLSIPEIKGDASDCYSVMARFVNAKVLPADWAGEVISANAVPDNTIPADDQTFKDVRALSLLEQGAYTSAARFMGVALAKDIADRPADVVARISQPLSNVDVQQKYDAALSEDAVGKKLSGFTCGDKTTMNEGLRELLCFQRSNKALPPRPERIGTLLGSAMLGPQVERIVDEGVLLASFADLSSSTGQYRIAPADVSDIQDIPTKGLSADLLKAQKEQNGLRLLENLRTLVEALVFQQSVSYGGYTAVIAERALYDPSTRTLNIAPSDTDKALVATRAVEAMKANPTLARNVVLLALRHAVADELGSAEEANRNNYLETRYRWSYENFIAGNRCGADEIALSEWKSLLPGWEIQYRATADELKDDKFKGCPAAQVYSPHDYDQVDMGAGASVKVADFYVKLPNAVQYSVGQFEQPQSLLRALALRDKINQAITERQIASTVAVAADEQNKDAEVSRLSFDLLNNDAIRPN